MSVTMPNKKKNGKYFVSTKRPNLKEDAPDIRETQVSFGDDLHGIHGEKTEHFSKLKKRLQKKMA